MIEAFLPVEAPYRLDLTVAVLQRFSSNAVDVTSPGGAYVRALGSAAKPIVACVEQAAPGALGVRLWCEPGDVVDTLAVLRRMLGTQRRAVVFEKAAREVAWLRDLAARMSGVRSPRYPTLWEACVNAIVFQQVSLHAASAILRRTILALEDPVRAAGALVRRFPDARTVSAAPDTTLRAAGLSAAKVATLRRVAEAIESGTLDETTLERCSSTQASATLCEIRGIGPWTAAVILLRGLGRLDVFPANDSGVVRSLAAFASDPIDVTAALKTLGAERGMLYFHLLLARLEASGQLAGATAPSNH